MRRGPVPLPVRRTSSAPFSSLIGPEVTSLSRGMCGLRIPVRTGLLEHNGAIHNRVVAYAGETACMLAAVSLARSADAGLTEFGIEHVSPAYGDSLLVRATAALDEANRVVARFELFVARGDDEELCAVGHGSLAASVVDSQVGALRRGGLQ